MRLDLLRYRISLQQISDHPPATEKVPRSSNSESYRSMARPLDQAREHIAPADFAAATDLIRSLIASRSNRTERLEQTDVRDAIATIGSYVARAGSTIERLEATSLLGKVTESFNSKSLITPVTALIEQGLEVPLPAIGSWGNADDRRYLAKATGFSKAAWIPQYAAKALAQTELNEKVAREMWAELAISRADNLATVLRTITEALDEWLSKREDSIELGYRKVRRICEALKQTLLIADVPSGHDFGDAFAGLIRVTGGRNGADALKAREDAAASVLGLIIQILRLRFDVLFDSNMYRAVGTVRGWWRPARPPEEIERQSDRVAELAMKGLHILARQGVQDKELRAALSKSLDASRINSVGEAIAAADIGLDPSLSRFLATGQELPGIRSNDTMQQLNEQATDELLGRLLLAVANQDVSQEAILSVAGHALRRQLRNYKEQLFRTGKVSVELTTDQLVEVDLVEFLAYGPVVQFNKLITEMVTRSAVALAGDLGRVKLVATGGGAALPIVRQLGEGGVQHGNKQVFFAVVNAMSEGLRETHPDLIDPYPQIAVALGGSLPDLPEQRSSIPSGISVPPKMTLSPIYKS